MLLSTRDRAMQTDPFVVGVAVVKTSMASDCELRSKCVGSIPGQCNPELQKKSTRHPQSG